MRGFHCGEGSASYQQEYGYRRLMDQITAQMSEAKQDQIRSESQKSSFQRKAV
ncbi:hypothetical protein HMPREF0239_04005 [Clostridium sp. ATCC BAA-442]|nr:hypothetical protein HMPREF0239_04005 [Clostridium sp. ATCC BAA-442]